MPEQTDRFRLAALAIFATAFAVRILHVWQMRASPFFTTLLGDSRGYDEWARRIAAGEWIGRDVFYQAPLYPYMLGVVYAAAGRHLFLVRLIQAGIGSLSCVLLGAAAARLFGRRTGVLAGMMLALYAPAIFFDGLLQKSVLDVFFVCLALFLIANVQTAENAEYEPSLRSPRAPRLRVFLAIGATMGLLALTRENALVLIGVVFLWILFPRDRSPIPNPGSRALRAAWFLIGLAIVLLPVAARNAYVGGGFYITTSQAGPNLYIGNNPKADGTYQSLRFGRGAPEYERQDATELAERALGRTLTPAEVSSYWTGKAADFITSQPGAWLTLMARKFLLVWNATEMVDTESQEAHAEYSLPLRVLGRIGHFGVVVPLAIVGVVATWSMRRRLWVYYAMIGMYAASVVVFYVFARYRYPLVPMVILFAAAGVIEVFARLTTGNTAMEAAHREHRATRLKKSRSLPPVDRDSARVPGGWITAALVAAAALFCNWPILSASTMKAVTETNLGAALQTDGRVDEARTHYERAIAIEPDYAPAYNNLGTALRASGRLNEAVAAYQRALRLRSEYPDAHYNLANTLSEQGKAAEAAEHFRIALQTIAGSADVHNNLGIALMAEEKPAEAIAEFRSAVAADPQSAKAHRNLADALASARQPDEAVAEFRAAARLAPDDAAVRYDLGSLLLELNRTADAIQEFRASLQLNPRSPQTHNNLGIALGSSGRLDEAIREFRAALAIDPDFADAKRNLAMAEAATKR